MFAPLVLLHELSQDQAERRAPPELHASTAGYFEPSTIRAHAERRRIETVLETLVGPPRRFLQQPPSETHLVARRRSSAARLREAPQPPARTLHVPLRARFIRAGLQGTSEIQLTAQQREHFQI